MRIAIIVLVVTAGVAQADVHVGAHAGGGLEGGLISRKPRPDAVGEVGVTAAWIPGDVGIGIAFDRVARPLGFESEHTLDAGAQFAVRGNRLGVGMGVRWLDPGDGQPSWFGYDWFRLDSTLPVARGTHASVDVYLRWTIGCYVSHADVMVERPEQVRDVSCADTLTTTYVVGVQASLQ